MHTGHKSHVVCNTNTSENTCNEVAPYNDACQSSNGDLLRSEVRRIKWEVNTQVMVLCRSLML